MRPVGRRPLRTYWGALFNADSWGWHREARAPIWTAECSRVFRATNFPDREGEYVRGDVLRAPDLPCVQRPRTVLPTVHPIDGCLRSRRATEHRLFPAPLRVTSSRP